MSRAAPILRDGHQLQLLQGSGELFPALIGAVDLAEREVRLESYIFDFTGAGAEVAEALVRAAGRGVQVRVLVDGLGTAVLPPAWRARFEAVGVQWRVYSPLGALGLLLPGRWRRLHRKLCVVDERIGFCGGINILDDYHDPNHGALAHPRFDFAVQVSGPLVAEMLHAMVRLWLRLVAVRRLRPAELAATMASLDAATGVPPARAGRGRRGPSRAVRTVRAALLLRDNVRHRRDIERAYRKAISAARREIIIANAYFVPGGKMRRALVMAARRGVKVQLLLQGRYEYFMQYYASRPVYAALLLAGVEIHEYAPSFLHAKVAVIDGRWATVGSSNIDPLSLLLAREANVVSEDPRFAGELRRQLVGAMQEGGQRVDAAAYAHRSWRQRALERLALIVMRLALLVHGKSYL